MRFITLCVKIFLKNIIQMRLINYICNHLKIIYYIYNYMDYKIKKYKLKKIVRD